jgi:hypothetical protein
MDGHVALMRERSGVCRILLGKPKGKRPLVKSRGTWEDNIKMDLRKVGWGMGWIDLAQMWPAVTNAVMNPRVSKKYGEFFYC